MTTTEQPQRRRVPMPQVTQWPRVGKIRLGEQLPVMDEKTGKQKERSGEAVTRPHAVDYFRVDPEDEVTSPESAASFLAVYGEKPKTLRCQIPGRRTEDVWEGAYRLYGTRKLKIRCDGTECDERTATGGWATKPCICDARNLPKDSTSRCKLGWTLNVLLPDVVGMGVWQITTGSEISVERVSGWLQMMERITGDLLLLDFTLTLVPVDVTPDGRTKTVYVLEPRAVSATPQVLIEGGGRGVVAQIEPGVAVPVTPPAADDEAAGEDAPVEGDVVELPKRRRQPAAGTHEDDLWNSRIEELIGFGATGDDIAAASTEYLGRKADPWDLLDDGLHRHLFALFMPITPAQESMVPTAEHSDPTA